MKAATLFVSLMVILIAITGSDGFAQSQENEGFSKVGGLKLPDSGFGVFGTAPHVNTDADFTDYVPYYARFSLWVGGMTSKGEVLVTCGNGNPVSQRPEWLPEPASLAKHEAPPLPQVEKIISTEFSDSAVFDGHQPLDLQVRQRIYGFSNTRFAIIIFDISLDEGAEALSEVYAGLWVDVDATDSQNQLTSTDDKIGFALKGQAPFIVDGTLPEEQAPLLGAMVLGTDTPIISWLQDSDFPKSDPEQYAYLKGDGASSDMDAAGDYRFLLSSGPFALQSSESVQFAVTVVQAPQLSDFEDNLEDAQEFFAQELGSSAVAQKSSTLTVQMAGADFLPESFRLYQNFPNPFNPETRIQFDLAQAAHVELRVFNALGQLARTLVDADYAVGSFSLTWNGRDDGGRPLPSGIYFLRLRAGDFVAQRKLLLLK